VPQPGSGEVLVRVAAAALNPLDVKIQSGAMHGYFPMTFPATIGTDLSGTVDTLGAGVTGWTIGDRIVARTAPTSGGAVAEFVLIPADQLVALPDAIGFEDAAALPTVAGTAWQALFEVADLKAGQTILVHGGAGNVGGFAIQFARAAGARVIATASGEGIAIAERAGADVVIDYRNEDFVARVADVDVVLDTVGGDAQVRSFEVLRAGGLLASLVSPPDEALAKAHNVNATFVFHGSDALRLATVVDKAAGGVRPRIERVVPLSEASDAFAHQASGRVQGKVVIRTAS
jgi:NADPH:quinone reductase-like Zn-dependent oxidoreductase